MALALCECGERDFLLVFRNPIRSSSTCMFQCKGLEVEVVWCERLSDSFLVFGTCKHGFSGPSQWQCPVAVQHAVQCTSVLYRDTVLGSMLREGRKPHDHAGRRSLHGSLVVWGGPCLCLGLGGAATALARRATPERGGRTIQENIGIQL
eukprot:339086-Prymnesium_polylepis.1